MHDDSFIPAEEGRKVCQRREEETSRESQRERNDKISIAVITKRRRESVFRNRMGGEIKTDHVDPERPATYVAQSRTPDSNKAFITPEKPTMARKPPPEPAMAITGT